MESCPSPSLYFKLEFSFDTSGADGKEIHKMEVFVYSRDQIFLPSFNRVFGSDFIKLRLQPNGGRQQQHLEIIRTDWMAIDQENATCNPDATVDTNTQKCIVEWVNEQLSCRVPWYPLFSTGLRDCASAADFTRYWSLSHRLSYMNEDDISAETGGACLSPCKKTHYKVWPLSNMIAVNTSTVGESLAKVKFVIRTGRYEEKAQYYTYGWDSLIADIGGYLGLLLGHSVLSLALMATGKCRNCNK